MMLSNFSEEVIDVATDVVTRRLNTGNDLHRSLVHQKL